MGHTANFCINSWVKICDKKEKTQYKDKKPSQKVNHPKSAHYVVAHCNLVIEEVFSTSFSSWNYTWLLDTRATCHMTFRKDFFEKFSDQLMDKFTLQASLN